MTPRRAVAATIAGARTDTIMVLRLDPKDTTARLLSFPRDLWVPIAGTDTKRRINEAFQGNGPAAAQRLIETIKLNFGIPIDHYVQVNFASFKKLVDSIGGVPIYFDEPVRARSSGLAIPYAGCWTLDGTQALAFARARKDYQVFRDNEWQLDPSGDLGRINRQQYFLRVALKRAISKGVRNPATLRRLVDIGVQSVGIDEQLRPADVMDLGQRFRNFSPVNLKTYTVPVDDAVRGGAQVLELRADEAEPILTIFRGEPVEETDDSTAPLTPTQVRVQVVNGSRVDGQARQMTEELTRIGFIPVTPGNADTIPNTTLRYAPGRAAAGSPRGPVPDRPGDLRRVRPGGRHGRGPRHRHGLPGCVDRAQGGRPGATGHHVDHHDHDHRAGHDDHHHDARRRAPGAVAGGGQLLALPTARRRRRAAPARPRARGPGSWRR